MLPLFSKEKAYCLYLARGKRAASINESNRLNVFEVKIPIKCSREVVEYDFLRLKTFCTWKELTNCWVNVLGGGNSRLVLVNQSNTLNVFEVKIPIKWSREVVEYDLLRLKIFTRGPQNVRAKHLMVLLILKHKNCLSQTPKKFYLSSPKKVLCIECFFVSTILKRKCTSFFLYRKSASFNYTRKWVGFN